MGRLYLAIAVVGAIVPIALGVIFLQKHGLDAGEFVRQPFETTVGTLALLDLTISSVAFWVWVAREAPRLGIRNWGLFLAANVLVGLSFALPLFLYVRRRKLDAGPAPVATQATAAA